MMIVYGDSYLLLVRGVCSQLIVRLLRCSRTTTLQGVEVIEFDFLTPGAVADYLYGRGFLQLLWECGGTLSAPVIAAGVIHKVRGFIGESSIAVT